MVGPMACAIDQVADYAVRLCMVPRALCHEAIIRSPKSGMSRSQTYNNAGIAARNSWEMQVPEDDDFWQSLMVMIYSTICEINEDFFKFSIIGFESPPRLIRYEAPSGHFTWHADRTSGINVRKLSFSIQLSDPRSYQGGDLEIFGEPLGSAPRDQGALIVFPSYTIHRVSPVTDGSRHALVGWITGPNFS